MVTGGCLCGGVRFETRGRISAIWFCHCSKCRKTTGAAFHPAALCRANEFRWVAGEELISEYRTPSGYPSRFCRRCGSPVPTLLDNGSSVALSAGTLDGDPGSRPVRHVFVGSKAPWFEIHDDLLRFEEHAPTTSTGG
jgi:hypothetical protein